MYFKTFYNLTTQNMNDGFLLWLRKSNLYVKYKDLKHHRAFCNCQRVYI